MEARALHAEHVGPGDHAQLRFRRIASAAEGHVRWPKRTYNTGGDMLQRTCASVLLAAALALNVSVAAADPVADFYKDKQIKIIIGNAAGGDYDIGGRILARHIGNHIPGNPTVIVQNMPGASTVTATNFLYAKAPKDGTVIGSFSRNIASQAVIGKMNIE